LLAEQEESNWGYGSLLAGPWLPGRRSHSDPHVPDEPRELDDVAADRSVHIVLLYMPAYQPAAPVPK
jgi:hypothetical protein